MVIVAPQVAHAQPPIDAAVASLYVGKEVTVEGVVTAAERDGFIVRLRLDQPPQELRVQLILGMLSRFPSAPEVHYLGQRIRVFGKVQEFRGVREILVRDPTRIAIVDGDHGVETTETEQLQERLQQLEERLRALEAGANSASPPSE